MFYRPWEDSAPVTEMPIPVTHTKPLGNAGAGHDSPDAENSEREDLSDEQFRKKKRSRVVRQKRERILIVYQAIKRWPMGERAEMDAIDVMAEVQEEAQKEMLISGLKNLSIPRIPILDFGKRGKSMTRAA